MRTKRTTVAVLIVIGISFGNLVSCGQNTPKEHKGENKTETHDGHNHNHSNKEEPARSIGESSVKSSLTSELVNNYLLLKNALVKDDSKAAASAGELLLKSFSDFNMTALTKEQHKEYMDIAESAKEQIEHIIKSNITHQREHFEVLSTDIHDILILVGTEKTLYQDYCPMASDGAGASWLSETKEIANPYFGSKMAKCGEVKKKFN